MIVKCDNCGAALEGARAGASLRCEYCGTEVHVPPAPPAEVRVEPFRPQVVAPQRYTPTSSAKFMALGVVAAVVAMIGVGVVLGVRQQTSHAEMVGDQAKDQALEQQRAAQQAAQQQVAEVMSAMKAAGATPEPDPTVPPEVDPLATTKPPLGKPSPVQQATAKPVVPDVDAIAYDVLFATTIRSCVPKVGKLRAPGTHPRFDVVTKMRFDRGWAKDVTATVSMVDDPNQFAPRDDSLTLGAPLGASGKAKVEAEAATCTKKAIEAHHFRSTKLQNAAGDVRMTLKFENDVTFQSGSSP